MTDVLRDSRGPADADAATVAHSATSRPAASSENSIRPFRIDIPQADLDDLRQRLARTRWPDEQPSSDWSYGIPLAYLRELADYWQQTYDWLKHEARLNTFPQFTTTIDGTNVHFIHVRSPEPDAMPLLLTHGWPGSIVEFQELIEPLANPRAHGGDPATAFHVVCPSVPGYGFSGPTHDRGWDTNRVARAFAELMARLGYGRYIAHGVDWGSRISRDLGIIDAVHVAGIHIAMLLTSTLPDDPRELTNLSSDEQAQLDELRHFQTEQMGYGMLQSNQPQTIAYSLADSPIRQLAWITEKFQMWTDTTGTPESAVDRDQMLTNVMLYWLTNTAGSAARLYYEVAHGGAGWGKAAPSTTPTGVMVFPKDISRPIRRFAERTNKIVHWSTFDRGGHFPAMEEPDLVLGDLRAFSRQVR
jgi:pimeloyl-ACP methyl ester carboxylesterase